MNLSSRSAGGTFHQPCFDVRTLTRPLLSVDYPCTQETIHCHACAPQAHPAEFYSGRSFPPLRIHTGVREDDRKDEADLYEVRIIDNDYNTYQEVIEITMAALGITHAQAYAVAYEVDFRGSCVVAHAPKEEAEVIAGIIRSIDIEVQVNPLTRSRSS